MAYKIDKDERNIEYNVERKQFLINIDQVQSADPSNFISMVESWEKKLGNALSFVKNEQEILKGIIDKCEAQHKETLDGVKKEIENLKESVLAFNPALTDFKTNHPEEYKLAQEKLKVFVEKGKSKAK